MKAVFALYGRIPQAQQQRMTWTGRHRIRPDHVELGRHKTTLTWFAFAVVLVGVVGVAFYVVGHQLESLTTPVPAAATTADFAAVPGNAELPSVEKGHAAMTAAQRMWYVDSYP